MRRIAKHCLAAFLISLIVAGPLLAQSADSHAPRETNDTAYEHADAAVPSFRTLPKSIVLDQRRFWLSPARLRASDVKWLVPVAFGTALSLSTDTAVEEHLPARESTINRSKAFSDAGLAGLIGTAGGMFAVGTFTQNKRLTETGFLSGQALADTLLINTAFKVATGRDRPLEADGRGRFWRGSESFPSDHSAASWAIASVIAHEYPGWMTKFLAYGTAAGVSAARVTGRKHFTSDVVVGGALGYLVGRQVYKTHTTEGDGSAERFGTFIKTRDNAERDPNDMGSAYVPVDSWVYPAFDRLAALGYVQTAFAGQRPWSRIDCAKLALEAKESAGDEDQTTRDLLSDLLTEFAPEVARLGGARNAGAEIESIYARTGGISGTPLRDGYHFAQTLVNDYGRPYGDGVNAVTGASARAEAGPFAFYLRGEFQRAAAAQAFAPETLNQIAQADGVPTAIQVDDASVSRVRLLEAYLALKLGGCQMSFGRQSLWWGPTESPMLFNNNAEPVTMFRLDQSSPFKLPSIFGLLGAIKTQFFIGQLSGQRFAGTPGDFSGQSGLPVNPQPYIHGEKVSFKPTENLEFSISRTVIFGGPGFPVTLRTFQQSFLSTGTLNNDKDPGDRRSGFDFSYRVPGLRKWLVIYTDSFTDDEISPLGYPREAAWNPGMYLPQIPRIPRLDFRAEGVFTPPRPTLFPGFYYYNVRYRSGYTNDGMLMGNWVGREGKGLQLSSTYWLSARIKIQAGFRGLEVDRDFLKGGRLQDFKISGDFVLRPDLSLSSSVQYERWRFPLLSSGKESNVAAAIQLTYWPRWRMR